MPSEPRETSPSGALIEGLQALSAAMFPKVCSACGRVFESVESFAAATGAAAGADGLLETDDEAGRRVIALNRTCPCGSTLVSSFKDRRDTSRHGQARRKLFGEVLELMVGEGLRRDVVRDELLKMMNGEASLFVEQFGPGSDSAPGRDSANRD